MLVGTALLHAQGNDTLTSLRQSFPKSITAFKIMGNTKAVVVCDNASFLEFSNLSDVRDFGKAKDFAVTNGDTLWLNTDGIPVKTTLYIHIDSSAKATNIAFSGHSYGLVTGLVNGDVSISAKGHSRVVVSKGWGDTIRSGNISIQTTDSAFVNCISPMLADTISLSTDKASNIETNLVKCAILNCDENDIDNGVKFRKVYSVGDKKNGIFGGDKETAFSKGHCDSGFFSGDVDSRTISRHERVANLVSANVTIPDENIFEVTNYHSETMRSYRELKAYQKEQLRSFEQLKMNADSPMVTVRLLELKKQIDKTGTAIMDLEYDIVSSNCIKTFPEIASELGISERILHYKLEAMRIRGIDIDRQELERYEKMFSGAV